MPKSPKNPTKTKALNRESLNTPTSPSTTRKTRRKLNENQRNNDSKQDTPKNNLNSSQNSIKNDEILDCETITTTTTKRNAFEMMMDSRSKVIGRNSPGKERESDLDDDDDETDRKSRKITRKLFLENWADSKGASKRKRIDEEIEQSINKKMKKRSKRLKNMLKIKDPHLEEKQQEEKEEDSEQHEEEEEKQQEEKEEDGEQQEEEEEEKQQEEEGDKQQQQHDDKQEEEEEKQQEEEEEQEKQKEEEDDKQQQQRAEEDKQQQQQAEEDKQQQQQAEEDKQQEYEAEEEEEKRQEEETESENSNEAENNQQLSDKNVKAWRMKIKLCMEENQEKIVNNSNTNSINGSRLVGGRVLRKKKLKPNFYNEDLIIENDKQPIKKSNIIKIDLENTKQQQQQSIKIAPVFRRSLPKPKIDPTVLEAKREFLLSGIPTSFKKELTRHSSFEDYKHDVFPTVSHVQQINDHNFWNLPKIDLKFLPEDAEEINFNLETSKFSLALHTTSINNNNNNNNYSEGNIHFDKIECYKPIVEMIKSQNPNYPIYRMFKILYEQSGYRKVIEKNVKIIKKRGRKKKNAIAVVEEMPVVEQAEEDSKDSFLWTEKYKPKDSKQILGNHHTITSLKNWLSTFQNNKKSNNNHDNDSESEFDTDDSRDSLNTIRNNTVILTGPNGCGKTCAIYAICNELDYNVIEINSSMKRTGKRLLHDLQEATQSHQVRRQQQQQHLANFLNKPQQQHDKDNDNRKCVLLIEDIDIVFEQEDESFYSALNQISSITKRPIILTTNNYNALIEQKFLLQFQLFRFQSPASTTILLTNIWLQLLCLIEGIYIDLISIKQLLDKNYGDIRRTLLELQFWVNTGGQRHDQQFQQDEQQIINIDNSCDHINDNNNDDDDSSLTTIVPNGDSQLINYKTHYNCINCFETILNNESTDLERIWWNLPNFLHLPDAKTVRLRTLLINNDGDGNIKNNDDDRDNDNKKEFLDKLDKFSTIYDNLSLVDFYFKSSTINSNLNRLWQTDIKDSLSLNEHLEDLEDNPMIGYDLSHYLIFNNLQYYGFKTDNFNAAVPEPIEIKWRNKMRSCDKNFRNAVPLMTEHSSIILDYMPILRDIARTELQRSIDNTKRNNRFYNYLRNLGVNCNDKTYKLACNIFKI